MKGEYYEIRKNSIGFSNNGRRFKGKCCKDMAGDWFERIIWEDTYTHTHTHTTGDLNNLHFLL